jgi:acetoacetyl-CoA synthetase
MDANTSPLSEGDLMWSPSAQQQAATRLADYMQWLVRSGRDDYGDYASLWNWSVSDIESFWRSIWDYFDVDADGSIEPVLGKASMPGAQWFPNTRLNYAEHMFRGRNPTDTALIARSENEPLRMISWATLAAETARMAELLLASGVKVGDRVAAYMPNREQTVIAFLACASLGAIWSGCSPDMGLSVVLDRFRQIEPTVLFAVDSYSYNGKVHDRAEMVEQILGSLPSLRRVIHVEGPLAAQRTVGWRDRLPWPGDPAPAATPRFERVPFAHPLWIVYSSGTTGLPKPIVHGHGGILLTHYKSLGLQHDVRVGDRMLFLGSTGWIVWNTQIGALLAGAAIVLYDGNPNWPTANALWQSIDELGVTQFGCGATYLTGCMKAGLEPAKLGRFEALRLINSTGSPLPLDAFRWVYGSIKQDLWLGSISGGTDIASGLVACSPLLPVRAGEIQCAELGVAAYAYDEHARPIVGEVGELVVTKPMPSMPVFFWNDTDGTRYRDSYFDLFEGVWRHGDWIRFTPEGGCVIYGRSDTTINRHGIRMGTAEIYAVVEALPEVQNSLVVDLEYLGRPSFMPLFVVLAAGVSLDDALRARIAATIRTRASARHVPDAIVQVNEIPYTLTGKKMELPVRKLLLGADPDKAVKAGTMSNPGSLDFFLGYAAGRLSALGTHH